MLRPALALAGGTTALALVAAALVYALSEGRLRQVYRVAPEPVAVASDAGSLARGRRLAASVGQCGFCHGSDLAGRLIGDDPWLGRLYAPNLTPGRGGIGGHSDLDLVRAVRHGVARDGRPLVMMPSHYLRRLDAGDLGAILGYLRSLPPVDRELPPPRVGPLGRLALALGRAPDVLAAAGIDHSEAPPAVPEPGATRLYGRYLAETAGCKLCHHSDLAGGLHPLALPGEPVPPDITSRGRLGSWTEDQFLHALRTGHTPDGRTLDDRFMPWPSLAGMSDLELRAIWRYLRSLPEEPVGGTTARVRSEEANGV